MALTRSAAPYQSYITKVKEFSSAILWGLTEGTTWLPADTLCEGAPEPDLSHHPAAHSINGIQLVTPAGTCDMKDERCKHERADV